LQCQSPVQSSKFKSVLKKRKKGNVSDVPNQKKERESMKKATYSLTFAMSKSSLKFEVQVYPKKKKKRGH
jgi:hypothetical protein